MRSKKASRVAAMLSSPTTACLSIRDCKVEIPSNLSYEQINDFISIEVPQNGRITIAGTERKRYATRSIRNDEIFGQDIEGRKLLKGLSIELLNPKTLDVQGQFFLKEVLRLYSTELPEMSFAANTGKESPFLEKCVTSGKYCTLLLKRTTPLDSDEVLAALSYQILPPDTQYAEIPLAAVSKCYQNKGIGSFLFNELKHRLHDVGVLTIFCWGDQESEKFWLKQGFLKVAEVDGHGKPRKLPIKPDVRRAMSIPGSATLLVLHMYGTSVSALASDNSRFATPPRHTGLCVAEGLNETALELFSSVNSLVLKPSPAAAITTPPGIEFKSSFQGTPTFAAQDVTMLNASGVKGMMPLNIDGVLTSVANENAARSSDDLDKNVPVELVVSLTLAPQSLSKMETDGSFLGEELQVGSGESTLQNQNMLPCEDVNTRNSSTLGLSEQEKENICPRSAQRSRKRGRRGASKSQSGGLRCAGNNNWQKMLPNKSQDCKSLECGRIGVLTDFPEPDAVLAESPAKSIRDTQAQQDSPMRDFQSPVQVKYSIMFMNMSDDNRRLQLTKYVEKLGGIVTNNGNECTHAITGEARRTFNFCVALSRGAWVVTPTWLKASVKEHKFVEEGPFVLKDKVFEMKYKTKLEDAILRAKQKPCGLLDGLCVYPTKHVQPPLETISAIILSAGGTVLSSLPEIKDPCSTIVVASEADMSEALMAAKAGLPTYSSEWLMSCIMKQELDLTSTQFIESL